ncbi:flavin adenine dinucleotide transporter [Starmerella bacillaris]|uniref:Flavin adenine dinucleotide transporter n=1 Tax=Starmerella bacillaris TaxID=1247836 RepID=A0AAV5RP58_STABA|nr:flavin adenine dinucleotide transporter [Starmerella bacillaris]
MRSLLHVVMLLWASVAYASEKQLQTSALLSCQQSTEFSAQKFDITFYPSNRSAQVDVEFTSAIDGNFTVDLVVYAFGINIFTTSISGCDISDTICPISPGRFDVSTNLTLPEKYTKEIPGIAYTFPDIDAWVIAKAYYVGTDGKKNGSSIACLEAQISNGKTVKHSYVSWITFGIIIFGVLVSGAAALWGHVSTASHIIANSVSLFAYFQTTATIGMMAVEKCPPIAAAWCQNFMWTMGIISVEFMQTILTWYVRSTGGTPTVILANKDEISTAVYKRSLDDPGQFGLSLSDFVNLGQTVLDPETNKIERLIKRVAADSNSTTTNERDSGLLGKTLIVQGIKRVAYLGNIELTNFFLTGATFFIFIGIAITFIALSLKGIIELLVRTGAINNERFAEFRANHISNTKGVLFRYFVVGFTQLSLLCLWEFYSRDSVATVVDACVLFAVVLISLSLGATKVLAYGRKSKQMFDNPSSILFGNPEVLNRWGFLYVQYSLTSYYFLIPYLIFNFARSATIGLGQSNGKAQAIVFLVIEVIYCIVICCTRPFMDKKSNAVNISISVFSIVNAIFFLFFSRIFGSKVDAAASIMGLIYFVMNAIVSLAFLILIIFDCIWVIIHPRPDTRYQPVNDDRNLYLPPSMDQKDDTELADLGAAARDGYHMSYLHYDPSSSDLDSFRHAQSIEDRSGSDYISGTAANNFQNYREMQSQDMMNNRHGPEDKLL